MAVLAKVLNTQVRQLILGLGVVNADLAFLLQLLLEKLPQHDVLFARAVGAVDGDVQRRRVVDVQRHAAEALVQAQLQCNAGAEHHLFHCQSCRRELCLLHGLCGQPL